MAIALVFQHDVYVWHARDLLFSEKQVIPIEDISVGVGAIEAVIGQAETREETSEVIVSGK